MKVTFLIIGLLLTLAGPVARAQTNPPETASTLSNTVPADALTTKMGVVYNKFHVEKADPGGLTISYVPEGGGIGIERVPFEFLPDDLQQRYGYNPEKATQYDVLRKQAMAQWRAKMIADEKAYRERRAQLEAAEAAEAAAKATNNPALQATNAPDLSATNTPAVTATNPPPPRAGGY